MNLAKAIIEFMITFVITLVVTALVTYLYSLIVHGSSVVDWGISVRLGIILGVVLTISHVRNNTKK